MLWSKCAVHKFSDFAEEARPLDGEKIKIDAVLGREIEIIGYAIRGSKYEKNRSGKCLCLQLQLDGYRHVLFTGSDVLIDQMQKYGDRIPFAATIKKIDRYFVLT